MTTPATKLTYQDYLLLPDDGKRYEIMDGGSTRLRPLSRGIN